jgi:hypothetical protein
MEQYKINLLNVAWNEDLVFSITCNDIFCHAADAEDISSQEDVDMLEQAAKELLEINDLAPAWASILFTARKRKKRPLGSWFIGLDDEIANLFDACGPERKYNG